MTAPRVPRTELPLASTAADPTADDVARAAALWRDAAPRALRALLDATPLDPLAPDTRPGEIPA